jgi:hypothetical protein
VGAEGFEPPSTGFHHAESDSARSDMGHRSSYSSLVSKPNGNHSHNWSPLGYQTTPYPRLFIAGESTSCAASGLSYAVSSSSCATSSAACLVSSKRENFSSCVRLPCDRRAYIASFLYSFARAGSGPVGNFGRLCAFRTRDHWLSPDPLGTIEGQCYIQTKPPAHLAAGGHWPTMYKTLGHPCSYLSRGYSSHPTL